MAGIAEDTARSCTRVAQDMLEVDEGADGFNYCVCLDSSWLRHVDQTFTKKQRVIGLGLDIWTGWSK